MSCSPGANDPLADELPFVLEDAFPGQEKFDRPLLLEHTPEDPGHLYVVGQNGKIWRIPEDGKSAQRQVFYDGSDKILHPRSGGHNEEGLLGFAFDPAYAKNRHVWLYYSERIGRRNRQSIIARFQVTMSEGEGDASHPIIDPKSELRVMKVRQPWGNHNGGTIVFGPDKMLYIALGDGGAAGDPKKAGQDLAQLLGSVLRIDVRKSTEDAPYEVPEDNPFVGREDARGEIWAYGLRNPWRITFDRETGDLWCADVGQNAWEEVNRLEKGKNYGWRALEGTHTYDAGTLAQLEGQELVPPVAEYSHREGVSVTGGYVYRGKRFPELVGRYLYGDFVTGRVWSVREDRKKGKHDVQRLLGLSEWPGLLRRAPERGASAAPLRRSHLSARQALGSRLSSVPQTTRMPRGLRCARSSCNSPLPKDAEVEGSCPGALLVRRSTLLAQDRVESRAETQLWASWTSSTGRSSRRTASAPRRPVSTRRAREPWRPGAYGPGRTRGSRAWGDMACPTAAGQPAQSRQREQSSASLQEMHATMPSAPAPAGIPGLGSSPKPLRHRWTRVASRCAAAWPRPSASA